MPAHTSKDYHIAEAQGAGMLRMPTSMAGCYLKLNGRPMFQQQLHSCNSINRSSKHECLQEQVW